ncbi:MAG: hypothetical protein GX974_03985 [Clostridiales bacterium]|nr:hypothetical protein [Clostridiales bacterium]
MSWNCFTCKYLDKSDKIVSRDEKHYRYGCKDRYIVSWIAQWKAEDTQLKNMGCSDYEKRERPKQIAMF